MVTYGHIIFPKVLWMEHHQIIFYFNDSDMVQISKPMLMVINWYKTDDFFQIYYQTENMNRKGIIWVKASEWIIMPRETTRHP